ncbi:MAG: glycosyltransferase [Mucilaginibacter sp.]
MKVIHILNAIEYSGAEIMLYQAAGVFKENKIDTTLLACYPNPGKFEQPMREVGYHVDSVGAEGAFTLFANLFKYFKKNKFDVVHIHSENYYVWKVIILKLTGHNNIVRTFHNNWEFTGWLRYKRALHRNIATWLGVKNHSIGTAVQLNEEQVFFNKSIVINNWIKLNPDLLSRRETVSKLKREELGIAPDTFVMISVGGCSYIKNHGFIFDLIPLLNQAGLKVCYLHVGTGDDEPAEKTLSKKLGLDAQVIFTGNRKDVPELLLLADIYMMPSLFEGLSIALLEAMYYNGLALVNNAPGLANVIVDKKTGYVIDIDQPQNYVKFIQDVAGGAINATNIKAAAKAFVEDNYVVEKNAAKLIEFYKQ